MGWMLTVVFCSSLFLSMHLVFESLVSDDGLGYAELADT
jgi:hypothetical protein